MEVIERGSAVHCISAYVARLQLVDTDRLDHGSGSFFKTLVPAMNPKQHQEDQEVLGSGRSCMLSPGTIIDP